MGDGQGADSQTKTHGQRVPRRSRLVREESKRKKALDKVDWSATQSLDALEAF